KKELPSRQRCLSLRVLSARVSRHIRSSLTRSAMLEAVGLTKRYSSIPAVQELSFTLRPGQVLGCLGPNGSGKSTTVKMLTGLLEPSRGLVQFNGRSIQDDVTGYRNQLGYVPEEAHLYPFLTGWEYLELVGTLRGMPRAELESKIDSLLQLSRFIPLATSA